MILQGLPTFLHARPVYLADKLYLLRRRSPALVAQTPPIVARGIRKARLLVLGRQHYFETLREYRISSMRDLAAAIRLEAPTLSPYADGVCFYHRHAYVDGISTVSLWFVRPQVWLDHGLAPQLVIPETLLLNYMAERDAPNMLQVQSSGNNPGYFFYADAQKLISQPRRGAAQNAERFARLAGIDPSLFQPQVLDEQQLAQSLAAGLQRLPWVAFPGLWLRGQRQLPVVRWRRLAAIVGGLLFGYLVLSSAYLYQRQQSLQAQWDEQRVAMRDMLALEQRYQTLLAEQQQLSQPLRDYVGRWRVAALLAATITPRERLEAVRVDGNTVELRGFAPRASGFLATLSQQSVLADVQFAAPVRKVPGGEQFVIRATLQRDIASDAVDG